MYISQTTNTSLPKLGPARYLMGTIIYNTALAVAVACGFTILHLFQNENIMLEGEEREREREELN